MSSHSRLNRTPALWVLYALLGLYAFFQNAIGPAVPFLRAEFHLDYTMAALHMSVYAIGMIVAGLGGPAFIRRWGLQAALWGGQIGTLVGLTALVLAPNPWVSLLSIFFAAVAGSVSTAAIQSSVSDLAGPHRGKALMEATMTASLTSAMAPFVLVLGTVTGTGWRTLWPVFLLALIVTAFLGFRPLSKAISHERHSVEKKSGRLPRSFARFWILILVGVALEWCIGFWATEYLRGLPGGSVGLAAAGAGTFQLAAFASRWVSSRLTGKWGEKKLLLTAVLLTGLGFPLYWSLANPFTAFLGLFLCGWGVANFFPLALSLAIGTSEAQAPKIASFASIAAGLAILVAPLALGALADRWSLSNALLVVPIGLLFMLGLLLFRRKG